MRRRSLILFGVLVCGLAVIALLWVWTRSQFPSHTLPDGSKIILRSVTYGNSHQFAVGNIWQRIAARALPSVFAKRYPILRFSDTNSPTLMLWFEHVGNKASTKYVYGGHPKYTTPPDWQALFDDSGTDFGIYYPQVSGQTPGHFVQGFRFGAVPSSSRQLHFRCVIADKGAAWNDTTVFTFDNPAYRPQPTNHITYPITLRQGNLKMVVTYFRPKRPRKDHLPEMELEFAMFENGKPTPLWELHDVDVFDIHGGAFHPGTWGWGHPDNRTGMEFNGGLGTNSLWKLRLSLRHGSFLTNEFVTITNLSLPQQCVAAVDLARIPFNGTTLVVRRDADHGDSGIDLKAVLDPEDENFYMTFIEAPRANGKPFDWSHKMYVNGQNDTHYLMGFPSGTTNIDLKFGITKKVFMDITAEPMAR